MNPSFHVNNLFTDHMVLQREKPVPIWGTGTDGQRIIIECGSVRGECVVRDGSWRVVLPPMKAGGPHRLLVKGGGGEVVFHDVLFGDVWLAGGQSNMEWILENTTNAQKHIASANNSQIRCYEIPRISYEDGREHPSEWLLSTSENAPKFSAVAYHFAKNVTEAQDIPIGIINCSWGGTSAACWMSEGSLENDRELSVYLDEYAEQLRNFSWDAFETEQKLYDKRVAEYNRKAARGVTGSELGDYPWPPPFSPRSFMRPCGLYKTMLSKARPYALKGFIYYQGESDAPYALIYDTLLEALIRNWRADWEDPELPFLFVQLPPYGCEGNPDGEEWALLRESQRIVSESVPNTGMAVALDCGDLTDIHPKDKQPVGERLALVARQKVYGEEIESSGPVFLDMLTEGNKAVVRFGHTASGLSAAPGDEAVIGFEVAGEDGVYHPAQAAILGGNSVEVWSELVDSPIEVRYGWANYTEANLANTLGLPAEPFRTNRMMRDKRKNRSNER